MGGLRVAFLLRTLCNNLQPSDFSVLAYWVLQELLSVCIKKTRH
jgi:hypothetical protein